MKRTPRILLVNKFYYPRGGDCICMLNLEDLLRRLGYEVAVYSMSYPQNWESEYSGYFAAEISFGGRLKDKLRAASRIFGLGDIRQSFEKILNEFKPDVVHFHNIHSYLSPVVVKLAKEHGCRTVWTMHDYKLLCPSYSCLCKGEICEACFTNRIQVVRRKCMKDSALASALAYGEALWWSRKRLERWVDTFVCPSSFMAQKMKACGYDYTKLSVVCNFIEQAKLDSFKAIDTVADANNPYYCYVGRLSEEKGVRMLLDVASALPHTLYVAGTGPLEEELRGKYASSQIVFLGHLSSTEVVKLIKRAQTMVVPSIWYENNPLSVIESLCMGTPVIGAEVGGIPELVREGDGRLFRMGDKEELATAIDSMMKDEDIDSQEIAQRAQLRFAEARYWEELKAVYGF